MESQWFVAYECKASWGETLYVFRHCKGEESDKYFETWVGDGFVESREITKESFISRLVKE